MRSLAVAGMCILGLSAKLITGCVPPASTPTAAGGATEQAREQAPVTRLLQPEAFLEAYASQSGAAYLLDVRTPTEFEAGALPGAVNIDYRAGDFKEQIGALDTGRPVFVYCHGGGRSASAAGLLLLEGFIDVTDMRGGYSAYRAAGLD